MNVKDRSYNQLCWEMDRRKPDWRMRSPSVEGRDNITRPERGPLGPGGTVEAPAPHIEAGLAVKRGGFEGVSKLARTVGYGRISLSH